MNSNETIAEHLYPETSSAGREVIRQQQQQAKESWETYCTNLMIALKNTDNTMIQWTQYNDGYNELEQWLIDMEANMSHTKNLMNTLQEKRDQLQTLKVRSLNIIKYVLEY